MNINKNTEHILALIFILLWFTKIAFFYRKTVNVNISRIGTAFKHRAGCRKYTLDQTFIITGHSIRVRMCVCALQREIERQ